MAGILGHKGMQDAIESLRAAMSRGSVQGDEDLTLAVVSACRIPDDGLPNSVRNQLAELRESLDVTWQVLLIRPSARGDYFRDRIAKLGQAEKTHLRNKLRSLLRELER